MTKHRDFSESLIDTGNNDPPKKTEPNTTRYTGGRRTEEMYFETESSKEFITPLTMQALSGNPVFQNYSGKKSLPRMVFYKAEKRMRGSLRQFYQKKEIKKFLSFSWVQKIIGKKF